MKYKAEWEDGCYYEFEANSDKFALLMVKEMRKVKLISLIKIVWSEDNV